MVRDISDQYDSTSSTRKICEDDIFAIVNDSFLTGCLPKGSNDTLIALVSKVESPIAMSQLRPIYL